MVRIENHATFEEAITAFSEESKQSLREFNRHRFYSPEARRKHHRGKTNSKSYSRGMKQSHR